MSNEEEYSVLVILPDDGQKCLCFGHKTFCCREDMEDSPRWHEVEFKFLISSYKIKKSFPEDIEESILEYAKVVEIWKCLDPEETENHVIGVTVWRKI